MDLLQCENVVGEGGEEIASQFACENGSGHLSCRVKTFDFSPIISQPSLLTT